MAAPEQSSLSRALAVVRDALRGEEHDFTRGDLRLGVALLAIPMVLEMGMESIFGVVDVFFVSRLGSDAVAAVGLTEALMILVYALGFGLGVPAMSLVAQRTGEKKPQEAARTAVQVVALGAAIGLLVALASPLAPAMLTAMGASEGVVGIGAGYTSVMLLSSPVIILLFTLGSVLRGAGDAAGAMRALWIANGINIVLDPCLIFGLGPFPELGLTGAAIATLIGRGTGVAYQLSRLLRGARDLRVAREHLSLRPAIMAQLLRMSVGGIGQNLVETASWLLLVRIVSPFGSVVLAGYTIAVRVLIFALMPAWGLANAAATLVGQNLGAGRPERAAQSVWLSGWYNTAFLTGFAVLIVAFDTTLMSWFTDDPEVLREGATCVRIIAYGYVFYGWGMVMVQAFNGSGHTGVPLVVNLVCFWLVKLPLSYALARPFGFGPEGVWVAVTLSYTLSALVGIVLFRRGRWRVALG